MFFKKIVAFTVCIGMLGTSINSANAQDYSYAGGCGYLEYRSAPSIATSVALSALALGAIVAVAIQHSNHDHSH